MISKKDFGYYDLCYFKNKYSVIRLHGYLQGLYDEALTSIVYWRKHRHHTCYNCHKKGHISADCANICPHCNNKHSKGVCIFELNRVLEKFERILKRSYTFNEAEMQAKLEGVMEKAKNQLNEKIIINSKAPACKLSISKIQFNIKAKEENYVGKRVELTAAGDNNRDKCVREITKIADEMNKLEEAADKLRTTLLIKKDLKENLKVEFKNKISQIDRMIEDKQKELMRKQQKLEPTKYSTDEKLYTDIKEEESKGGAMIKTGVRKAMGKVFISTKPKIYNSEPEEITALRKIIRLYKNKIKAIEEKKNLIQKYRKVESLEQKIQHKEEIINRAYTKANEIIEKAKIKAEIKIENAEIKAERKFQKGQEFLQKSRAIIQKKAVTKGQKAKYERMIKQKNQQLENYAKYSRRIGEELSKWDSKTANKLSYNVRDANRMGSRYENYDNQTCE